MDSRTMATLSRRVQDCARKVEQMQDDITLHLDGIAPPDDIMNFHWQRLNKATAEFNTASDELSFWLHLQLTNIVSFRNQIEKKLDKSCETRLDF